MKRYEQTAVKSFGSKIVSKATARMVGLPKLPQYCVEWLVAHYCNPGTEHDDIQKIRERVAELLPDQDTREAIKQKLLSEGRCLILDKLDVQVDLVHGTRIGTVQNLGISGIYVPPKMVERIPRLLQGGAWGSIELRYQTGAKGKHQVQAYAMTAFQETSNSLDEFQTKRAEFSTQEWVDLLLASVGYCPDNLSQRTKLLLLTRLIPMVEANLNLVELGPRQTGKTYLLRNVSASCYTASGASITAASMFGNLSTGAQGAVSTYKVVVLDEIAHTTVDDITTVSILKDFMESGQYGRGSRTNGSDASIVMTGNIDVEDNEPSKQYRHLFEVLPSGLQDTALLDRVHGYIPGWEVPVLEDRAIHHGLGLSADYVGQALQGLRSKDFRGRCHTVLDKLSLPLTRRDIVAVEKMSSGLLKIMHPDGLCQPDELAKIVVYSCELRRRVVDQLAKMAPGEFGKRFA